MANSSTHLAANNEKTAAYMRNYYLKHSTRPRMIAGAERAEKRCRSCGIVKDRSEYTVRASGPRKGHLATYCKSCSADKARGTYQVKHERDPTVYRRVEWPSKLKRLYGISVDDYNAMLIKQGEACGLCGTKDPSNGNRGYARRVRTVFDVDHCHKTGRVRGLLCTRCNRLVGLANDNPETARKLLAYLS